MAKFNNFLPHLLSLSLEFNIIKMVMDTSCRKNLLVLLSRDIIITDEL